jgi:hypothetical protein
MSHELGLPKRREFRLELSESRRISPEMDQHPDTWTGEGVKGGLIGFYREIAGAGHLHRAFAHEPAPSGRARSASASIRWAIGTSG